MKFEDEYQLIDLNCVIKDIAAGPFGSNLKVECFTLDGFPIIDGANLKGYKVTDNITKFVTAEKAKSLHRAIANRGDVVVTISGTLGQIAYVPDESKYESYLVSQRQFRVTFDTSRVSVPYLVYYFHTYEGQNKILEFANQVGVPALSQPLKNFRRIKILLPPINVQKKIADIISTINAKIEINTAINNNLQQQFALLYQQYFIENRLPEWDVVPLEKILYFQEGPGIRNWQYVNESGTKFINIRCIDNGDINTKTANMISTDEANNKYSHFMLKPLDIVMSCSGTLGRYAIVRPQHLPLCLNTSVIRFSPKIEESDFSYIYGYLTSSEFLDRQTEMACGSVQSNFGPTHLKRMFITDAPISLRREFHKLAFPLILQTLSLRAENDGLAELRDNLLPKLMSGEIDVSDIVL